MIFLSCYEVDKYSSTNKVSKWWCSIFISVKWLIENHNTNVSDFELLQFDTCTFVYVFIFLLIFFKNWKSFFLFIVQQDFYWILVHWIIGLKILSAFSSRIIQRSFFYDCLCIYVIFSELNEEATLEILLIKN